MRIRNFVSAACLIGLAFLAGCTTIAKEAYYTATGPQGSYMVVEDRGPRSLAGCSRVEVALFDDTIGAYASAGMMRDLRRHIVSELQKDKHFAAVEVVPVDSFVQGGDAKTCVVTGSLQDFTSAQYPGSRLVAGSDHIIVRSKVLDKATREVLVDAVVRGVVKAAAEFRSDPQAIGLAKGFDKLLVHEMSLKSEEN